MNILTFDCEHSAGVYKPWREDFILSCVGYSMNEEFHVLWFDHENYADGVTPDYSKDEAWKTFQEAVKCADLIVGHNLKHDINICRYLGGINFDGKQYWDNEEMLYRLSGFTYPNLTK